MFTIRVCCSDSIFWYILQNLNNIGHTGVGFSSFHTWFKKKSVLFKSLHSYYSAWSFWFEIWYRAWQEPLVPLHGIIFSSVMPIVYLEIAVSRHQKLVLMLEGGKSCMFVSSMVDVNSHSACLMAWDPSMAVVRTGLPDSKVWVC